VQWRSASPCICHFPLNSKTSCRSEDRQDAARPVALQVASVRPYVFSAVCLGENAGGVVEISCYTVATATGTGSNSIRPGRGETVHLRNRSNINSSPPLPGGTAYGNESGGWRPAGAGLISKTPPAFQFGLNRYVRPPGESPRRTLRPHRGHLQGTASRTRARDSLRWL
jgi:hypothetical protein